jgi:hypothetical protein
VIARRYGASPLHLLAHGLLFAAAGWVLLQVLDVRRADNVLAWFLAALIAHDLVLLPLYSLLDRAAVSLARRVGPAAVPVVNHVRVPTVLSALTFVVFLPLIMGLSDPTLERVSGRPPTGYLMRWLLLVAALFAASGLLLGIRIQLLHRARAPRHEHPATR